MKQTNESAAASKRKAEAPEGVSEYADNLGELTMPGFDEKSLALYAKGMTARDIQEIVRELYGVEIPATLASENRHGPGRGSDHLADAPLGFGVANCLFRWNPEDTATKQARRRRRAVRVN